ncbi:hypothetical protein KIV65_gp57 [Mycobacterium phage Anthony]|uniref:Uncharacterized protein n=1 Tax=Mycobacterium phage Anthony TaxID=2599857 RepID=A0A5J6THR1_9CAUD|nr:hypothetical protein KIV65_gp57 [Mycobacterium phage Anthony]QFG10411.1 hypothetical protein PBI_ANTHONY_40 [Mycobacterium phage Anthony]
MADRLQALVLVPRDDSLPVDVQGVGLRRMAIDAMKEIATVVENSVRYKGATDDATVTLGDGALTLTTWQSNLIAARFIADGKAKQGVVGPSVHSDHTTRTHSSAVVVRDPYN